ncbi:MAG: hypothetical protein Q4F02_00460 [Candidatus Saccharibacteria bacterium]|nr:hypothetical protein [Candidatus Saccharibacteria bacterium]
MFTNRIPTSNVLIGVEYTDYARRHFLKGFQKKYRGKQWEVTEESIFQDLARISFAENTLQHTQQVDELWHADGQWIFKYDFRVAQTKVAAKDAGNRCVVYYSAAKRQMKILLIYSKNDLPKNCGETQYIKSILESEFDEIWENFT